MLFLQKHIRESQSIWTFLASFQSRRKSVYLIGEGGGVGSPCKFSSLTDVFASVIVSFPPNFVIRVSFCFLASKVTELLRGSLFPFFIAHRAWSVSDGYLFVQSSCSIILIERLNPIDKTWFFTINRKRSGMYIFLKIASIAKTRRWIVTSTTLLFRKV